jgi:hypothetical protein
MLVVIPNENIAILSCVIKLHSIEEMVYFNSLEKKSVTVEFALILSLKEESSGVNLVSLEGNVGIVNHFVNLSAGYIPKKWKCDGGLRLDNVNPLFTKPELSIDYTTKPNEVTDKKYSGKDFLVLGFIQDVVENSHGQINSCILVVNVNESIQVHMELHVPLSGKSGIIEKINGVMKSKLCLFLNCRVPSTQSD